MSLCMWMRFVGGELERDRWVLWHSLAHFAVGGLANHECGEDSVYPKQLARKAYSKHFNVYSKIAVSTHCVYPSSRCSKWQMSTAALSRIFVRVLPLLVSTKKGRIPSDDGHLG